MVDVRVVVRGLDGAPLAGANVAASASPEPVGLRATMLAPRLPAPGMFCAMTVGLPGICSPINHASNRA